MKNNQNKKEQEYIMNTVKKIFLFIVIITTFYMTILLSLFRVNVWPFVIFSIFVIFLMNIYTVIQNFEIFKIGKDGVELKRITQDAQSATQELKKMASLFAGNMAKTMTKLGRWDSSFTIKELYKNRKEIENLLSSININDNEIKHNLQIIDNFIIFDIINILCNRYNITEKIELKNKLSTFILNPNDEQYNLDICGIKNCLIDYNELDDINSHILSEVEYYQNNNTFKTNDFLTFIEKIN
ncbi:MAG: hypothetical protein J6J27_05605 [Alphaproteobacteria bacterium]|nr:hypothetical protein [Alphaproteobacteria bacterium]